MDRWNLPTHYTAPPTDEQQGLLEQRRAEAEAHPLVKGMVVSFSVRPETVDPQAAPSPEHASLESPVPLRSLSHDLLDLLDPGRNERGLRVRLVRPLQTGADEWSQVWTADVEDEAGKKKGRVVVKLLVEALFPFPIGKAWPEYGRYTWWCAETLVQAEAESYAAFRPLQGRDVPYCYGVSSFRMPWGEDVPGLILEDLSKIAILLSKAATWPDLDEWEAEDVDDFVCRIFEGLHRLQDLGRTKFGFDATDILVLKETDIDDARVVFIDFGGSHSVDFFLHGRLIEYHARSSGIPLDKYLGSWRGWDETNIMGELDYLLGKPMLEWGDLETHRNRLNLSID
ncbi:hypothetical protein JCM8547_001637 [Rhodosporidiobolus lusitaniae]